MKKSILLVALLLAVAALAGCGTQDDIIDGADLAAAAASAALA